MGGGRGEVLDEGEEGNGDPLQMKVSDADLHATSTAVHIESVKHFFTMHIWLTAVKSFSTGNPTDFKQHQLTSNSATEANRLLSILAF